MLNASRNGSSGLSDISAATKKKKSPVSSRRNLIRSHQPSGRRVVRSLSRGLLTNSRLGVIVMAVRPRSGRSLVPHGPGVDDLLDVAGVLLVADVRARDEQCVELGSGLI